MSASAINNKPKRYFTLADGFVVSIILHGLVVLVWLAAVLFLSGGAPVQNPPRQMLDMDILGMLSERQVIEIAEIPEIPAPPEDFEPEPEPEPEPPPEDAVRPEPPKEKLPQQVKPQTVQPAQTIAKVDEKTVMQNYLAGISRSIQESLTYPEEAKAKGWIGEPLISFTILSNGGIKPGSLKVSKSCGHPILDQQALETVRKRAPFSPPPREITITIGISFKAN